MAWSRTDSGSTEWTMSAADWGALAVTPRGAGDSEDADDDDAAGTWFPACEYNADCCWG